MRPEAQRGWPWSEQDLVRLRHILDAARQIESFVSTRTRDSLHDDDIPTLGLQKAIEIIGEAASGLAEPIRHAMPDVPWPRIIGMRHRLVHAYFEIDLDMVWATATRAVPDVASAVRKFLDQWETS